MFRSWLLKLLRDPEIRAALVAIVEQGIRSLKPTGLKAPDRPE